MNFDEILKEPKYQAEFDKKVAKAIETAKTKWDEELAAKQKEMEENAKLTVEERTKKELEDLTKERDELKSSIAKREMKDKGLEYIKSKGYNQSVSELISMDNFENENDLYSKLDEMNNKLSTAINDGVNSKLQENGYSDLAGTNNQGAKDAFNFNFTPIKEFTEPQK